MRRCPTPGCSGCIGGLQPIDALTSTSSHELCEAITDPIPGAGWYDDTNGEIGDICAWQTKKIGNYPVQLEWSNRRISAFRVTNALVVAGFQPATLPFWLTLQKRRQDGGGTGAAGRIAYITPSMFAGHSMLCPYGELTGISFWRKGILAAAQSSMLSPERPKSAAVAWLARL